MKVDKALVTLVTRLYIEARKAVKRSNRNLFRPSDDKSPGRELVTDITVQRINCMLQEEREKGNISIEELEDVAVFVLAMAAILEKLGLEVK